METVIKKVKKLIAKIKSLSKETINETQKIFLEALSKTKNSKKINEFLTQDTLYTNTEITKINGEKLTVENWKQIIEKPMVKKAIELDTTNFKNTLYYTVKLNETEREIVLNMKKLDEPFPPEVHNFIREIDKVQNTINELFLNEKEALKKLTDLAGIAQVGGTSTYNALALNHLEQYKKEITIQKGSELKGLYLKKYGINIVYLIITSLVIIGLIDIFKVEQLPIINPVYLVNGLFLSIGTSIGAWLIFAIKKREIDFYDLRFLKDTKTAPLIRLIVILLIALCFYFMFITDFMNFKIGNSFDTATLKNIESKNMAFLIGLFFGLSESTLGAKLTSRVETFITKL